MDLNELRRHWEQLGESDPLWAIMTWPGKEQGRWKIEEFFATGRGELGWIMQVARDLGHPARFRSALDFGCGVGRMTQALAEYADQCLGLDISQPMVEGARRLNPSERCRFALNSSDDLRGHADATFDLVHSCYVLQHMHPEYARRYLREFMRVLEPGGTLLFQMASDFKLQDSAGPATTLAQRLPPNALRATVTAPARCELSPFELATLQVDVRNDGREAWPALAGEADVQIKLASRWLLPNRTALQEDQRTVLPWDQSPGDRLTLPLRICAPAAPGEYLLEVGLLQEGLAEGVAWFEHGMSPVRTRVLVRPQPASTASASPPTIEMYCIPRREVLELLRSCGATAWHTTADESAGPAFVANRYWIRK